MFEVSAHPWTDFTLLPESCHVFWKRWFFMSPERKVLSPVRRMGFPSRLEESLMRLWVRVVGVPRPPLKELLLRSRRRLNHRIF